MNIFDGILEFKGTWRTYQKRVLDNSKKYLTDNKIHIVAAPGSGKTTLGIELIRRLGQPCLVLSPSITIREQWISRIKDGFFVEGNTPEEWLSNDIKKAKSITAITYQALHSCMKQYVGVLDESEDENTEKEEKVEETVDFSGFNIYGVIKNTGIKTVCLDEAHHLRSEWWKALEEFIKNVPDAIIISLTATPPYDSEPAQWKRYIDLCGTIDEEIFTPELVKEGSLCPHQDYIYFNWPTAEEKQAISEYTKYADAITNQLTEDKAFIDVVASHVGLSNPKEYGETFLDNPQHFIALLSFLKKVGVPVHPYLLKLTGKEGKLPKLTPDLMEALLQGVLYDDTESYSIDREYRETLIARLKQGACIHRNKVRLARTDEVKKLLMSSKGKLNSINDIVKSEYASMGNDLRLLVLCDYIKKDYLPAIGVPERSVNELGAIPIFENIRRQNVPGLRIGVLTGSVVIVPTDVEQELSTLLAEYNCEGRMSHLGDTGYSRVDVKGNGHHIVSVITELFTRGRMNTLVGTKSLLGEGWDSPCINSLILATYVGSFMLSNQMRGRAIRVFKDEPDKASNIWHLACVFPEKRNGLFSEQLDGDYDTLVRRFEAFLGVSFDETVIENGIERMKIKKPEKNSEVEKINKKMLDESKDREGLRNAWAKSLRVINEEMRVSEVQEVDKSLLKPGYVFFNAAVVLMFLVAAMGLHRQYIGYVYSGADEVNASLYSLFVVAMLVLIAKYGIKLFAMLTPQKRMKQMANGMLAALEEAGKLEEPYHCRACVEEVEFLFGTYLKGGTTRDQTLYAKCMSEFLGVIDNPRYLLVRNKGPFKREDCYAVPEIFAKNKSDAETFAKCMKRAVGSFEAVYTRTPEGRKLLFEARTKSFVNNNAKIMRRLKKMY